MRAKELKPPGKKMFEFVQAFFLRNTLSASLAFPFSQKWEKGRMEKGLIMFAQTYFAVIGSRRFPL